MRQIGDEIVSPLSLSFYVGSERMCWSGRGDMLRDMESHTSHTKSLPRLGDACPDLVKDVVTLLREASPDDPIAHSIADLPFHGVRRGYVLTAPEGAPTPSVMELERGDEAVFLVGIDPSHSVVTWVDVLDGRDLPLTLLA
ncbi:hypothetical protein OOK27_12730 [Streptomyces canus]|uniref:hypothetical protein n=1 Tax=Streptomyces canus TaxID=58343 RepID=UPI0022568651|nr:hypothetical protein [Streptomyces canus]MCX5255022.1 hypothetical protein [Streptomyces canus]